MFLHPCKKCLVRAACTQSCKELDQHISTIIITSIVLGFVLFLIILFLPMLVIKVYYPQHINIAIVSLWIFWLSTSAIYIITYDKFTFNRNLKMRIIHIILAPIMFLIMSTSYILKRNITRYVVKKGNLNV